MRQPTMIRSLIIAVCIVVSLGTSDARAADKSPVATMHKPVGSVECSADGPWKKAVPAMPLYSGNRVRTGAASFAIVKFLERSILRVQELSEVTISGTKSPGKEFSKNVLLGRGTVGFSVKKRPNEKFEFTTPTSVASIRGTEGALISERDSSDLLVLSVGIVVLTNIFSNRSVTVNQGETGLSFPNGQISVRVSVPEDLRRMQRVQLLGSADSTGGTGSHDGRTDEVRIKMTNPQGAHKTMIIKYE